MKKLLAILVLFVAALSLSAPVYAARPSTAKAAPSPAQQKKDLARIQTYLNALRTVSADFLQIDDMGGIMRGQIAISRPGKMRITYDPPNKDFIIADGNTVHIWDDALQSQTNIDQESSLAEFILRDPIKFEDEITVTKVQYFPSKIEVTLIQTNDPGAGSLTLVFQDRPLKLRQWKVIDAQGRSTGVSLENMSEGAVFPGNHFVFIPPTFGKNR